MAKRFDCALCQKEGWIDDEEMVRSHKGRTCYLFGDVLTTLAMPNDGRQWTRDLLAPVDVTANQAIQMAADAYDTQPSDTSFYDVFTRMFPQICPMSLVDAGIGEWIEMEGLVNAYHTLPYPGSLLEQPSKALQTLAAIRSVKNQYELKKIKDPKTK